MTGRILKFDQFKKINETYIGSELTLSPQKTEDLVKQLAKVGITKNTPGKFKFVDDNGSEFEVMMTPNGELEIVEEVTEDLKKSLVTGIVCTMLASGLISCKRDTSGFGYNIASTSTEYTIGSGNPNKKITISTPQGEVEYDVDTNLAKKSGIYPSSGTKFVKAITPTEAFILKAGHAYSTEKNMNNGKGTPPNRKWDYDPKKSEITGGQYYPNETAAFETCREHPLWELGLEILRKEGYDVDALIRKANEEVSNGTVFQVDDF